MRLETFPLVLGIVLGVIGLALLVDAWSPDERAVPAERRRRFRMPRDRAGEALLGAGVIAMALAFAGRDTWRYSVVAVIAGTVFLLWGAKRNAGYIRGLFTRADVPPPLERPPRVR